MNFIRENNILLFKNIQNIYNLIDINIIKNSRENRMKTYFKERLMISEKQDIQALSSNNVWLDENSRKKSLQQEIFFIYIYKLKIEK